MEEKSRTELRDEQGPALRAAKVAAEAADPGPGGDGGTCNFDAATIRLPRMRKEKIERLAAQAGVDVFLSKWFGKTTVFVSLGRGQANRRTMMAEAATKALKEKGLDACTYYRMD